MQDNSYSKVQQYLNKYKKRVCPCLVVLIVGAMVCACLTLCVTLSDSGSLYLSCAIFNVALLCVPSEIFSRISADIQKMLYAQGDWLIETLSIQVAGLRFAIIPVVTLPGPDLIGAHRVPPPLAPTSLA